jgi:hypothetical protein
MTEFKSGKFKNVTKFLWLPTYINKKICFLEYVTITYKKVDGKWVKINTNITNN